MRSAFTTDYHRQNEVVGGDSSTKTNKRLLNVLGERFGKYTVIKYFGRINNASMWTCRCDCGQIRNVSLSNLRCGGALSCGCAGIEKMIKRTLTHGHSRGGKKSREYISWTAMLQRCYNKACMGYPYYGGRGITVCDRWRKSFENFLEDMGEKPNGKYSIDRIDNNGNYEPSNCRWATNEEQLKNRSVSIRIEYMGETKSVTEWAEIIGITTGSMRYRLSKGLSIGDILSEVGKTYSNEQ
jgi:hypothetical protein